MKAALMVDLPDVVRARLEELEQHYEIPADRLCQFWLVNVINNVWLENVMEMAKRERDARQSDG